MDNGRITLPESKARTATLENEAGKRANAEPLPGPLSAAFGPEEIKCRVFSIRKVVAYDWQILKQIKSAFYENWLEWQKPEEIRQMVEMSDATICDLIFLLSRPCIESWELINVGIEQFKRASADAIVTRYTMPELLGESKAVIEQFKRHNETFVRYVSEESDGSKKNSTPASPASNGTGLAGG